jgi:hypothetical protein
MGVAVGDDVGVTAEVAVVAVAAAEVGVIVAGRVGCGVEATGRRVGDRVGLGMAVRTMAIAVRAGGV